MGRNHYGGTVLFIFLLCPRCGGAHTEKKKKKKKILSERVKYFILILA